MVGFLLGPSFLGYLFPDYKNIILNPDVFQVFQIIPEVGLGLIIFTIGGEFRLEHVKRLGKSVLWISFYMIVFTIGSVGILSSIYFFYGHSYLGNSIIVYSILLGVIATSTGPSAVLLVLREYESVGPITRYILVLLALNDIIAILLFKLITSSFIMQHRQFYHPFIDIILSVSIGVGMGILLSYIEKWLNKHGEVLMLVMGGITLNIGIAYLIGKAFPTIYLSNLLINLFMGITLINSTTKDDFSFKALKNVDLPIYAVFFVIAGASLHVDQLFKGGILIVIYIIGRSFGTIYGAYFGVRFTNLFKELGNNIGLGLIPQAGVTIGLALILKREDSTMGETLSTIILASVVVFEVVGPLFTRYAIIRGGEVREIVISKNNNIYFMKRFQEIFNGFKERVGIKSRQDNISQNISCRDLMRRNVDYVKENLTLDGIIQFASECHYDQFYVVNRDHVFIGSISHKMIRDIILDKEFAQLIIASDIMKENPLVAYPDDDLETLMSRFHNLDEYLDYLPVVDRDYPPYLIGMVNQKDVISAYRGIKNS